MTCAHEGHPTYQTMRAVDGEAVKVTACEACATPDDLDPETYEAAKAALPDSYANPAELPDPEDPSFDDHATALEALEADNGQD